jgi:hypothetical protein
VQGGTLEPTELDADVIAKAATVLGSCNPDDGVDRNAGYMWTSDLTPPLFYFRTALQASCLANANCGCAAVDHCLGLALERAPDCVQGCDGDVFNLCEGDVPAGYRYRIDCAKVGLSCDPLRLCVDRAPVTCDAATAEPGCNDSGEGEFCADDFVQHGPVCADFGLECAAGECVVSGGASCTNESFAEPGDMVIEGLSCADSVMEACINGTLGSIDCATRGPGFSCQSFDGLFFCGLASECVPPGDGAPSPSHPASCDGTMFTFCNAGRLEHIDCLSLGFTGCEIDRSLDHYGCTPGIQY